MESGLFFSVTDIDALPFSIKLEQVVDLLHQDWMGNLILFLKETPREAFYKIILMLSPPIAYPGLPYRVFTRKAWRTDSSWSLKPWLKLGEDFIKSTRNHELNSTLCLNGCFRIRWQHFLLSLPSSSRAAPKWGSLLKLLWTEPWISIRPLILLSRDKWDRSTSSSLKTKRLLRLCTF